MFKKVYFWVEEKAHQALLWCIRQFLGFDTLRKGVFRLMYHSFSRDLQRACEFGVDKALNDPQIYNSSVANLGWEPRRNEACEWAKHYLRYRRVPYKDRDINIGCELLYQGFRK